MGVGLEELPTTYYLLLAAYCYSNCGHTLTPKRCSSGQLYSEGARGTPSGTRRARDKLISALQQGGVCYTFPQSSPSQKREGRPCRPHEGCQVGLIVIR
jgi:hypothetical protein